MKVYLTENIDYSLDEENCRGLRLFFKLAREAGIIPVEKELHFVLSGCSRSVEGQRRHLLQA